MSDWQITMVCPKCGDANKKKNIDFDEFDGEPYRRSKGRLRRLVKYQLVAMIVGLAIGFAFDFAYVHPDHKTKDERRVVYVLEINLD